MLLSTSEITLPCGVPPQSRSFPRARPIPDLPYLAIGAALFPQLENFS